MSYTKSAEPHIIPIQSAAQISGTSTLRGPLMPFPGEVLTASISSSANSIADDGSNKFVIDVRVNGNNAFQFDTNTTDLNAATVAMTESTTAANKRFAAGEEITVVFTETGTAVNFAPGTTVWVGVQYVRDYATEIG